MKGLVFIELMRMAEEVLGEERVDSVLATVSLPSGAAYTSVGYYDCAELFTLINAFSKASGIATPELERLFGHSVMRSFSDGYPDIFGKYKTAFEMLEAIEDDIHVDVRKLYPDAELPSFTAISNADAGLNLEYNSARPLAHFCLGLVEACFTAYGETATIQMEDVSSSDYGHAHFRILQDSASTHG